MGLNRSFLQQNLTILKKQETDDLANNLFTTLRTNVSIPNSQPNDAIGFTHSSFTTVPICRQSAEHFQNILFQMSHSCHFGLVMVIHPCHLCQVLPIAFENPTNCKAFNSALWSMHSGIVPYGQVSFLKDISGLLFGQLRCFFIVKFVKTEPLTQRLAVDWSLFLIQ